MIIARSRGLCTCSIQMAAQASATHWHSHPLPMPCMQEACNLACPAASPVLPAGLTACAALQDLEARGLLPSIQTLGMSPGVELLDAVSDAGSVALAACRSLRPAVCRPASRVIHRAAPQTASPSSLILRLWRRRTSQSAPSAMRVLRDPAAHPASTGSASEECRPLGPSALCCMFESCWLQVYCAAC